MSRRHKSVAQLAEWAIEDYIYRIHKFIHNTPLTGYPRRRVRWWARIAARWAFEMRPDLRD